MAIVQRGANFGELVAIMQRLLGPGGCPWDREQTLETLKGFLLEESYEVIEAIDSGDAKDHCEELGDLLMQVIFQAELQAEKDLFGIEDVIAAIVDKLVRRHPHVFADAKVKDSEEVLANWKAIKAKEHADKGKPRRQLDGVPAAMPALLRAQRLGEKAAEVGFDWPDAKSVRDKIAEELAEIDEAVAQGDQAAIEHEVGDLLLAVSRYAKKLGVEPEEALRAANRRFETRFAAVEDRVRASGRELKGLTLAELDRIWDEVKREGAGRVEPLPKK
jgi:MazG family protein